MGIRRRYFVIIGVLIATALVVMTALMASSAPQQRSLSKTMVLQAQDLADEGWVQESEVTSVDGVDGVVEGASSTMSWTNGTTVIRVETLVYVLNSSEAAYDLFVQWRDYAAGETVGNESSNAVFLANIGNGTFIAVTYDYPAVAWAGMWRGDTLTYFSFTDNAGLDLEKGFIETVLLGQVQKIDATSR